MFAVAAGLLMATSCSNELEEVKTEGEAVVSFTAELPKSMVSRAPQRAANASSFGDGTTATKLQYAVYEVKDDAWTLIDKLSGDTTLSNLKTTIRLNLSNGNTYAVAFWAAAPTSIYDFDKATSTVTANYAAVASSDENLDAFFAVKTLTINGSSQQTVELRRPFAQLNIGTGDLQASADANREVKKAGVTVKTYSQLNLKTQEVAGDAAEVTFALADLPTVAFPVTGYSYLAMNYLLMPTDKSADNTVTIIYDNASVPARTIENVPLQRNHRTNIYGNLLTSTTEFNIEVKPETEGEENVEIWDGATTKAPEEVNNVLIIKTPAEWAALCGTIVSKNIELAADLDFGDHELGSITLNNATVDGKGFTIKNVKLVGDNKCQPRLGTYHASLFCSPYGDADTIRHLTVKGAKVVCLNEDHEVNNIKGHAAVIIATIESGSVKVTLEDVHVIGADVYGIQPVAGLIGRTSRAQVKIDGCSVEDSYLHNVAMANESGFVATIFGRTDVTGNVTIVNTVSKNNTIEGYYAPRRGEASIQEIAHTNIDVTGVTASGNTITKKLLVGTTKELTEALAANAADIVLAADSTYYLKGLTLTADATISGIDAAKTFVALQLEATDPYYGEYYVDARGHKLTFNNVTYTQTGNGIYAVMEHNGTAGTLFADELAMNNCICNGTLSIVVDKATLTGCTVNNDRKSATQGYPIIVFGNDNCNVLLDNCVVNGVTKGIMLYAYANAYTYDLTVKDCKFISTLADDKAAIELHTEGGIKGNLTISNTTYTGFPTDDVYHKGLWHEIINTTETSSYGNAYGTTKRFNVTVDGEAVQEQDLTYQGAERSAYPAN